MLMSFSHLFENFRKIIKLNFNYIRFDLLGNGASAWILFFVFLDPLELRLRCLFFSAAKHVITKAKTIPITKSDFKLAISLQFVIH